MTILLPHLRQPAQWEPIDRGNPLTRDMVELVVPHHMRSAASAKPQMTGGGTGSRTWRAGKHGIHRWMDRAAVLEDRYPQDRGVTGDLTVYLVGGTDGALAATQRLLLLQTAGGTRRCALGEEGTSKFAFNTNPSGGSAVDAVESTTTLGEDHVYVGRLSGTAQTLWVDGVQVASATQSANNFSDIGTLSLNTTGFLAGGTGRAYLAGWLARAWSDEEIWEFAANPWALFRPRRIVVAGTGGGTSHTGDTSEGVTASDAAAVSATFGSARAEAVTASDAPAATAASGVAIAESLTPADTATGDIGAATYDVSRAESVTAGEAQDATAQFGGAASEALGAADAAAVSLAASAVALDALSVADAADGQLVATHSVAVVESLSPSDASTADVPGSIVGGVIIRPRRRYVVRNGRDLLVYDDEASAVAAQRAIDESQAAAARAVEHAATASKRAARRVRAAARTQTTARLAQSAQPAEAISLDKMRDLAEQYQRAQAMRQAMQQTDLLAVVALWHELLDDEDTDMLLLAA